MYQRGQVVEVHPADLEHQHDRCPREDARDAAVCNGQQVPTRRGPEGAHRQGERCAERQRCGRSHGHQQMADDLQWEGRAGNGRGHKRHGQDPQTHRRPHRAGGGPSVAASPQPSHRDQVGNRAEHDDDQRQPPRHHRHVGHAAHGTAGRCRSRTQDHRPERAHRPARAARCRVSNSSRPSTNPIPPAMFHTRS